MRRLALLLALATILPAADTAAGLATEVRRSPANQVFQFAHHDVNTAWADGVTSKASAYLWIPETCERLRGLLILCTNVPEHVLVGHPDLRRVCAEQGLGIVWCAPSFWYFGKQAKGNEKVQVDFLQKLLDGLAATSGYAEVATVPWLPIGESGHLLMVTGLVDQRPERCIAAICVKNPQYPKDRTVPMLWTLGTAQEWGQKKNDIRASWMGRRGWGRDAGWPLSALVEPGTGHFYITEPMIGYFARYISAACAARLPDQAGAPLKPVPFDQGALAWLPTPEAADPPVTPFTANVKEANRPWFFSADLAREAQDFARVEWQAQHQLPAFADAPGTTVKPFAFQDSIAQVTVVTDDVFTLRATLAPTIPPGFAAAGEPLSADGPEPQVAWLCGPYEPLGEGRFRIALDRSWKAAAVYAAAIAPGRPGVRYGLQPAALTLQENTAGTAQTITFPALAPVTAGAGSVPLAATASSGLPVRYYVESGPAVIEGDRLRLTPVPPRSRYPVTVTVVAWQWGQPTEPALKTAPLAKQTLTITGP